MNNSKHINFKTVLSSSLLLLGFLFFNLNAYSQPPGVFGNLNVTGNAYFSGASNTLTFIGNSNFSNTLTSTGNNVFGGLVNSTNSTQVSFVSSSDFSTAPNTPFFKLTKQYLVGTAPILPLLTATHKGIGIHTDNPLYALHVASGDAYFGGGAYFQGFSYFSYPVRLSTSASYLSITQTLITQPTNVKIFTDGDILVRNNNVDIFKVNTSDNTTYVNKLRVTLANPFPDYVFESNYKLKPLAELGVYIQKNKHLPNVPSAEEIANNKNQIDVGEMQVKLLEKVEELTLYILQQQKEIEALKLSISK